MATQKFKTNVEIAGDLNLPSETASRALTLGFSGAIESSNVTSTELSYLSGTTSAVQTQLDEKIDESREGAPNGIATLDAGGKVPVGQLPNSIMEYKGTYDASTNTPTLIDGTGNTGDVYRVNVAGTQDFGSGDITFEIGDYVIYNGSEWEKADATDAVTSVNGMQGEVVLTTDDVAEGSINLYFADELAQDATGTILQDTDSVSLLYDDSTPSITAQVIPGGVNHDELFAYDPNDHIDHSTLLITTDATSGLSGGGDLTTSLTLSVDVSAAIAETVADNADEILIYDNSAGALRKQSRVNFLSGVVIANPGDIYESTFSAANNQVAPANVTGLAFANASIRGFEAQISVFIDATADSFEKFHLEGIQKSGSWNMAVKSVGDDSGVQFSITSAGQVQYTSPASPGFVSNIMHFRAETLSV